MSFLQRCHLGSFFTSFRSASDRGTIDLLRKIERTPFLEPYRSFLPCFQIGILTGNTIIEWERQPDSRLLLIGKAASATGEGGGAYQSIINPNWDFNQMGIGGLDKEFSAIFRRTFASRMFPPAIGKQLGTFIFYLFLPPLLMK